MWNLAVTTISITFIRLLYHWSLSFGAYLDSFFFCYLSFMQIFVWLSSESPWKNNSIIQGHRGRRNWTLGFLFPRQCPKTHSFFQLLFHSWKGTVLNVHICMHTKSSPGDLQSPFVQSRKIISPHNLSPHNQYNIAAWGLDAGKAHLEITQDFYWDT